MNSNQVKELCESKSLVYKGDFLNSLTTEQKEDGYIKFNLPDIMEYITACIPSLIPGNGEGVWGWVSETDKEKYFDDNYTGEIAAILLNNPIGTFSMLPWGVEITLQCKGPNRPIPSTDWVREKIIESGWFDEYFNS